MIRNILLSAILLMAFCIDDNLVIGTDNPGDLKVSVLCNKIGNIGKSREISLTSLIIDLRAPSELRIYDTLTLTGNGAISVSKDYENLASQKQWIVACKSIDQNGLIIHEGSDTITIQPDSTSVLEIDLDAMYSMTVASFYPIADSCNRCVLLSDNVIIADSTFTPADVAVGDTVVLNYDYLSASPTGIRHRLKMDVYGSMWGHDTLLYTGSTYLTVVSGVDSEVIIKLFWVGPYDAPDGKVEITVNLGTIGNNNINGEIFDMEDLLDDPTYGLIFPQANLMSGRIIGNEGNINDAIDSTKYGTETYANQHMPRANCQAIANIAFLDSANIDSMYVNVSASGNNGTTLILSVRNNRGVSDTIINQNGLTCSFKGSITNKYRNITEIHLFLDANTIEDTANAFINEVSIFGKRAR